MTIRPFSWHDVPLLFRLRKAGICLEPRLGLTRGAGTFSHLLQDAFIPGGCAVTLVSRSDDKPDGFGQILHRQDEPLASLVYLAPEDILNRTDMIEALSSAAGKRGAYNLIASISESHHGFETLRSIDFHIYARQTIWRLSRKDGSTGHNVRWQEWTPSDDSAIQSLYINLVPALVQQVETVPNRSSSRLVYWEGSDLLGTVLLDRGPQGTWAQMLIHPAAEKVHDLIASFISLSHTGLNPLYVVVRSYQSWIGPVLEASGFDSVHHQAVMVKRLAVGLRRPAVNHVPVMDSVRPEVTASITDWESTNTLAGDSKHL